jgi:hypothetical protein
MTLKIFYEGNLTTTKNILKSVLTKHKTEKLETKT